MSEQDLEILITLDDPWYGPEEDTFHRLQSATDWPSKKEEADGDYNNHMLFTFV